MNVTVFSKGKRFLSRIETAAGKFIHHVHGYFLEAKEVGRDFFVYYDKSRQVWAVHDYLTGQRIAAAEDYSAALEAFKKTARRLNWNALESLPAINCD
jgi:hypothetical protein